MKIAVCEDEKIYSDKLCKALSDYFDGINIAPEITVYTDGTPLTEAYSNDERFDVVFLDLQLENSDGIETAEKIRKYDSNVPIIFVTGLENRAVEGYAVSAFDYIVKSSLSDRLPAVLDRYMQSTNNMFLTIQTADGRTMIVTVSDIIWAESDGRGSTVVTTDNRLSTTVPVSKIASLLPSNLFTEVHKSIYVNVTKIKCINSDTVEMCSGNQLPLSRRRRKAVMSAVMAAVKGRV